MDINAHPGSTEPEHYFHLLEQLYHSQHHIINKQPDTSSSYYVSHEALLLHYEELMTRQDSIDNKWYNCSAYGLGRRNEQPILIMPISSTYKGIETLSV